MNSPFRCTVYMDRARPYVGAHKKGVLRAESSNSLDENEIGTVLA